MHFLINGWASQNFSAKIVSKNEFFINRTPKVVKMFNSNFGAM